MAAFTGTAADVRPLPGAVTQRYAAAAASMAPGQVVYVTSSGTIDLADGDAQASAQARGILAAIQNGKVSSAVGDACDVVVFGPLTGFASMTPGAVVYVSTTAGSLDHTASSTQGDYNYIIGYAQSASVLFVQGDMAVPTAVP